MTRLPDWHRRLTEYLATSRGVPASAGFDGFDFVAGAVEAMTGERLDRGEDPMAAIEALPARDRPLPGDVVLLPGGAVGIWQGTCAYGLAADGWCITVSHVTPERAFAI